MEISFYLIIGWRIYNRKFWSVILTSSVTIKIYDLCKRRSIIWLMVTSKKKANRLKWIKKLRKYFYYNCFIRIIFSMQTLLFHLFLQVWSKIPLVLFFPLLWHAPEPFDLSPAYGTLAFAKGEVVNDVVWHSIIIS